MNEYDFAPLGKVQHALEIIKLLEEMKKEYALLMTDGNYQWHVLWNKYAVEPDEEIEVEITSSNYSLLDCLRDAKGKRWKP